MKNLTDAGRKIKLIVSDLDGTLLGTDKRISVINQRVIKKAKEKNILFTFCTGRIATMIEPYVKALGIDIPVITTNGAAVWDPVKKEIIAHKPVAPEEAMEITEYCRYRNPEYCALTLDVNYFSHNNYLIKRFLLYNKISGESNMRQMILSVMEEGSFFPKAKKLADYITKSNEDNGVAWFISQYILNSN